MDQMAEFALAFFSELVRTRPSDKQGVHAIKMELLREICLDKVPSDADLMKFAPSDLDPELREVMKKKASRTMSGVAVVAVMTSPEECPHGKCIFCPGGMDNGTPQSYTGREPAAMRAADNFYDPFDQVTSRLRQYKETGHSTDKVDMIIMGGTFPARELEYQREFIKRCYDALNEQDSSSLEEAMELNSKDAPHKCIGLTVETRPDHCLEEHVQIMLDYGTTRVELGVQTLDDNVLEAVDRGHTLDDTVRATKALKDAGIKVCYHMMPGLPSVVLDQFRVEMETLFSDERFKPDMLKIYPTLVIKGTKLYEMYEAGEYVPSSQFELVEVLADIKAELPSWVRIQRIQRDIPSQLIEAGNRASNLRQLVQKELEERGERCGCIRCREVGLSTKRPEDLRELEVRYPASGGQEVFLSLESLEPPVIVGYCRLRFNNLPSPDSEAAEQVRGGGARASGGRWGEDGGSGGDSSDMVATIRELKVFGESVPIATTKDEAWQHKGVGKRLMERAEELADKEGYSNLRVLSGVGVRAYYGALGYHLDGHYMVKDLSG